MKQPRAPFMPVTPDIDDDAIESLARDKGVGAFVKPVGNRAGEGASQPATTAAQLATATPLQSQVPATKANAPEATEATPRSRMKALNIELPDYAWTELKIKAARDQVSVRHIIMAALKQTGLPIADADMVEDGRRLRT